MLLEVFGGQGGEGTGQWLLPGRGVGRASGGVWRAGW